MTKTDHPRFQMTLFSSDRSYLEELAKLAKEKGIYSHIARTIWAREADEREKQQQRERSEQ
jgi:hypothetical protein